MTDVSYLRDAVSSKVNVCFEELRAGRVHGERYMPSLGSTLCVCSLVPFSQL